MTKAVAERRLVQAGAILPRPRLLTRGSALGRLPEKVAAAAVEFITGPLLDNPRRVGHPLRDEYAGQHSARRGPDWRVRYRIDQDSHTVVVLDVSHRSDTYGT